MNVRTFTRALCVAAAAPFWATPTYPWIALEDVTGPAAARPPPMLGPDLGEKAQGGSKVQQLCFFSLIRCPCHLCISEGARLFNKPD